MPADSRPDDSPRESRKERAAALVATGMSVAGVCEAVGIDAKTLWNWRQTPQFKRRVRRLRAASTERTLGLLIETGPLAVGRLMKLLVDPDPRVQLGAVRTALEYGRGLSESLDLADQLSDLERRLGEQGKGR